MKGDSLRFSSICGTLGTRSMYVSNAVLAIIEARFVMFDTMLCCYFKEISSSLYDILMCNAPINVKPLGGGFRSFVEFRGSGLLTLTVRRVASTYAILAARHLE